MNNTYFNQNHNSIALISLILSLPALMLVVLGMAQSKFGLSFVNSISIQMGIFESPFIIMGGIFMAIILNFLTTFRVKFTWEENSFSTNIIVRKYYPNLGILLLTGFLGATIFLYLLIENFQFISH